MLFEGTIPDATGRLNYRVTGPIFEAFLDQVALSPDSKALVSAFGVCSYGELEKISRRIAAALLDEGLEPSGSVAIVTDRNPALVYAMLAVLRTGARFSIIDRAYPAERILRIIGILEPDYLLLCGDDTPVFRLEPALRQATKGKVQSVPPEHERVLDKFGRFDGAFEGRLIEPQKPAYVTFTSGSTGQPKGVVTNHIPLVHFISWHVREHDLSRADHFSLLSGVSHDPIYRDIFTPLSIGASLHIPDQSVMSDPVELAKWLSDHGVTVTHLTPVMGDVIATGAESESLSLTKLRFLFWGGDALGKSMCSRMRLAAPNARQVNFYGATETPQAMAYHPIEPQSDHAAVPIGRGIDDVELLLVKENGELARNDERGEIWIRTPYLSMGYLNDEPQTRAKFVASPFAVGPGDTCYRTGDLGAYLPGTNDVAFIGRMDHQIKIRGFRIEPAEVAREMEKISGLKRAVAVGQEDAQGNKLVFGYFTSKPGAVVTVESVLSFLRRSLPAYMVPAAVIHLDEFPLLPNGKIDLRQLPSAREQEIRDDTSSFVPPSNNVERELVTLWQDLLGIEKISVTDDFQSLGGDSLTALRAMIRMKALGIPREAARGIFQGKTVQQIARLETENQNAAAIERGAQLNLMVNMLRGFLLAFVVAGHWLPTVVRRMPELMSWQRPMDAVFNIATPGFAFVFGLTLGKIYYPKYQVNPKQARRMLLAGAWILLAGFLIVAITMYVGIAGHPLILVPFNNVLSYYALAFATAPIWFRLISFFRSEYLGCALLMTTCFCVYQSASHWLRPYDEYEGISRLVALLLTAKFNYFNMTFGVLGGCVAGIYLAKHGQEEPWELAPRFSVVGTATACLGLFILYLRSGSLQVLGTDDTDMGLWRWLFYSGSVVVLAGFLAAVVGHLDKWSPGIRRGGEVVAVFGRGTFPIFVAHMLVWNLKPILVMAGVPEPLAAALLLATFIGFCAWLMSNLYQLYYSRLDREA